MNDKEYEFQKLTTIERLNSITYNYGKLVDSANCISFQKKSNRLAICTEKCIFILNLNLNYPQPHDAITPIKFHINRKKLMNKNTGKVPNISVKARPLEGDFNHSSFQIDAWIQDLIENKNEQIFINHIRSISKSSRVENVYKDFYQIEEIFKKKSFHKQMRELVASNIKPINDKKNSLNTSVKELSDQQPANELSSLDKHIRIVESNIDQCLKHKLLSDQHKLYDSNLHDYLNFLNPVTNNNQVNQPPQGSNLSFNYFHFGYKYCKWNNGLSLELLCAINSCNQLLLFNCTNLNSSHRVNTLPTAPYNVSDGLNLNDPDTYSSIFDSKSGSKVINLTEFWLTKYRPNILLSQKPKTLDEYYERIVQLIPIHLTWSEPFKLQDSKEEAEILFVTMKSNEIACFLVTKENGNVKIELIDCINVSCIEYINESNQAITKDETTLTSLLTLVTSDRTDLKEVSTITFLNGTNELGFLIIGAYNGSISISNFNLQMHTYHRDSNRKFFQIRNILRVGKIETINVYKIIENPEVIKILLVIKQLNTLSFLIIDFCIMKSFFSLSSKPLFYKICQKPDPNVEKPNFTTKSHSKIIKIELIEEEINVTNTIYKFWAIFENSVIKILKLKVNFNSETLLTESLEILDDFIINDTVQLKFDSCKISKETNDQFKMTRELFLSNDNSIIFQVNDYSKLELAARKITQLEINLYQINQHVDVIDKILPSPTEACDETNIKNLYQKGNIELTDLLWLFKINLYFKRDFFNQARFDRIHKNFKFANRITHIFEKDIKASFIIYFKRIRIIAYYLANYFEFIAGFDNLDQSKNKSLEDNVDDDDESIMDESNDNLDLNMSQSRQNDNLIIKAAPYYWSIFKDLTLNLFENHALKIAFQAYKIGFNKLSNNERLVLLLIAVFSMKNFFLKPKNKINIGVSEEKLKEWLEDNFLNIDQSKIQDNYSSESLITLVNRVKCDVCGKNLKIDSSNELNMIECELGHIMSRCQRSLLPLNIFRFKSCSKCKCTWNDLNPIDYPNLNDLFNDINKCMFCH